MSGTGTGGGLERRYRRLLAWYPSGHRAAHAEEMVGVLMAGAREGQTWPGARESADLLTGAARIRLRRAAAFFGGPCWRDALAVVSLVAPLLLLAWSAEAFLPGLLRRPLVAPGTGGIADKAGMLALAGSLAVAALVLLRWRRAAAVAALAMIAGQMLVFAVRVRSGWWFSGAPFAPVQLFLGVLTLVALLCSDGPRRGLAVLGRWRTGLIIAGVLALITVTAIWSGYFPASMRVVSGPVMLALTGLAGPIAAAALAVRSPAGRRVLLLTAPGLSPEVVYVLARSLAGANDIGPGSLMWVLYLVLTIVVAALAVAARILPGGAGPVAAGPGG